MWEGYEYNFRWGPHDGLPFFVVHEPKWGFQNRERAFAFFKLENPSLPKGIRWGPLDGVQFILVVFLKIMQLIRLV